MLTRHRSMTEASQSLRQIEMPKKTSRAVRSLLSPVDRKGCFMSVLTELMSALFLQSKLKMCVAPERPAAEPQKQEVQGVFALFPQFWSGDIFDPFTFHVDRTFW